MSAMDLSVVVVSFNTRDLLRECLTRLDEETRHTAAEVIVVDNASRDGSAQMVAEHFAHFHLIESPVNLGFAAANNRAFDIARGRFIALVNPDALIARGALAAALRHMQCNPRAAAAGARLQNLDGDMQPSGRLFPSLMNDALTLTGLAARFPRSRFFGRTDRTWADPLAPAKVDWVPGAFTLLRHSALREVGPFDERFFLYFEEVDLCRRLRKAGHEVWYWPDVCVTHIGGAASRTVSNETFSANGAQLCLWRMRSQLLYWRKHHGALPAALCGALEVGWLRLRALRRERPELRHQAALMHKAWRETQGGRVSPQRPW